MSALTICIYGACGRMGEALVRVAQQSDEFTVAALIDRTDHPRQGQEIVPNVFLSDDPSGVIGKVQCIIDFSSAAASEELVRYLLDRAQDSNPTEKVVLPKLVVGTTGQSPSYLQALATLAEHTGIVQSPNMSIGVNLCYHLVGEATRLAAGRADIEVIEAHHRHKTDAPSGTALELGRIIAEQCDRPFGEVAIYGRKGQTGERPAGQIGFSTIRAGNIVGEHTVLFGLSNETLSIKHVAQNRENFADGAFLATKWLVNHLQDDVGLYSMADVLNLPSSQL